MRVGQAQYKHAKIWSKHKEENNMHSCEFVHKHLLLDSFDGVVWLCQWMKRKQGIIGNIFKTPVLELWHGEKAQKIREKVSNGDFSDCRIEGCPYLQNKSLPDLSKEEIQKIITPPSPKIINLAHDCICNQYCETCRPEKFIPPFNYSKQVNKINTIITPLLNEAETISLSGHGDPFASPYMLRLMQNMRPTSENLNIRLETNGVLFTEKNWNKISHLSDIRLNVSITVNSFDPFTYKYISRGGNYTQLMKNLDFISNLRKEHKIKKLHLGMVIQDRNFREIPAFIQTSFDKYCCDNVLLKPVYQWGTMSDEICWFKDVLNPLHPYHQEYLEIIEHPSLQNPKVYNFGGRMMHCARPYPNNTLKNINKKIQKHIKNRLKNYSFIKKIKYMIENKFSY